MWSGGSSGQVCDPEEGLTRPEEGLVRVKGYALILLSVACLETASLSADLCGVVKSTPSPGAGLLSYCWACHTF